MFSPYVAALQRCNNLDYGNKLAEVLPASEPLNLDRIVRPISAYNENVQVRGSYGFNGTKAWNNGLGFLSSVNALVDQGYEFAATGLIERGDG
jgi:hypothetical protein